MSMEQTRALICLPYFTLTINAGLGHLSMIVALVGVRFKVDCFDTMSGRYLHIRFIPLLMSEPSLRQRQPQMSFKV